MDEYVGDIRQRVLERMDLSREMSDEEIENLIGEEASRLMQEEPISIRERLMLEARVFNSLRKLDALQELLDDPEISEIMVNGPKHIFYEKAGRVHAWNQAFASEEKMQDVIQQIVGRHNRVVNLSNPIVDTRLADGSRVNIVLAPVSLDGSTITIRKFPEKPLDMQTLIQKGALPEDAAEFLKMLVRAKYNLLISGGTSSGKTTFLNALSQYIPEDERVITIEDSAELQIQGIKNLVRLETRNANMEGVQPVTIRYAGLGDWYPNTDRLPNGIKGLAERIENLGMKFGLWIEPEMTNMDSDLYRNHPDWILHVPNRNSCECRHQYVLDYSRKEVVDYIYNMLAKILREAKVSYIKWDMNRSITECYSVALPADRQGEVFHRYILGVYDLYERLTSEFPHILFESCASGGARFDPGLLYYAPQGWASDDSDAIERLKIQYGTSFAYPISSIGSHVSVTPNHQVYRLTPLHTRANVAYFGTFGYELDLNKLTPAEQEEVKEQIKFMKEYREVFQFGTFYRLSSPFENNVTAWMVVSEDKETAIVGWYRVLNGINLPYSRIYLQGLNPDFCYKQNIDGNCYYGDELMNIGLVIDDPSAGQVSSDMPTSCDFDSKVYVLKATNK